jgi:3',5'-cyclic AMP phosphodiesterase CpdA
MLEIMQISDLHFGRPFIPHVAEILLETCAHLKPPVIVISGDLTQRAKRTEFIKAQAFLQQLPNVPMIIVAGNHDVPLYRIWERLISPLGYYQNYIDSKLNNVLRLNDAVIIGLDSTDPYRSITNGRLSSKQLELCTAVFSDLPSEISRVIVLHHHLIPAPSYERLPPMPKAKRALDIFTQLRVDLILAGHLHRAYVGNSLDVYSGQDREHGIIIAQCGTSTSRRGRGLEQEKNTFNWIKLDNKTIQVEHFMYFSDQQKFLPVARHIFARPRYGWLQTL